MGIKVFFESCPKCLPITIVNCSPQEATRRIETLQQNFEQLTFGSLCNPRDIRRLQMELQFMSIDIEETRSTCDLDTSTYETLVEMTSKILEEKVESYGDSSHDESPTSLEQVKELRSDMVKLLEKVEQQQHESLDESVSVFALVDVLKQLEEAKACIDRDDKSLLDQNYGKEFQEEVAKLQMDLKCVQHKVTKVLGVPTFSHDVGKLNDGYSSVLQELEQKHSERESEDLRKKIEEMERKHAAEVEALQSQLKTFMCTTVEADAVAVDPDSKPSSAEETDVRQFSALPSTVVEAEAVTDTSSTLLQYVPTAQVEVLATGNPTILRQPAPPVSSTPLQSVVLEDPFIEETAVGQGSAFSPSEPLSASAAISRTVDTTIQRQPDTTDNSDAAVREYLDAVLEYLEQLDDVTEILNIMRELRESARIQAMACEKLGNMASESYSNRYMIGTSGGIDSVLNCLRRFPKDLQLQIHGLFAIGNIARNPKENVTKIGKKGGTGLVLAGMKQFPKDIKVQRNGLFAISNLTYNNSENQNRIGLDGISLVVSDMRQFALDLNVQRNGLHALGNLASSDIEHRALIGELGGTDMILKAMIRFPKNGTVQERACSAIESLARSPKLRRELKSKEATKRVKIAKSVVDDKTCAENALHELRKGFR